MHSYVINFYVNNSEPMLARTDTAVMYPLETIKVNGVKCGALLNTGSGSSYISESLISLLKMNLILKEHKIIETIIQTSKN